MGWVGKIGVELRVLTREKKNLIVQAVVVADKFKYLLSKAMVIQIT